jgi:hypothetical protein
LLRLTRSPKFRGPALTGTAQVLSLRRIGSMSINSMVPKVICRIGLRVEVPGRPPYEVKVWQGLGADVASQLARSPWGIAVQPGRTAGVEVDSANPRSVRIVSIPSVTRWHQRDRSENLDRGVRTSPSIPVHSGADVLASGQRVWGALKSFAPTGTTPRSLGRTPSVPELLDAPHYQLVIELHFPNLAPMDARTVQPVPPPRCPISPLDSNCLAR